MLFAVGPPLSYLGFPKFNKNHCFYKVSGPQSFKTIVFIRFLALRAPKPLFLLLAAVPSYSWLLLGASRCFWVPKDTHAVVLPPPATRANATPQAEAEKADAGIAQRADPQRGSRRLFSTATRASAITKLTNQDLLREQQRQQTSKAP